MILSSAAPLVAQISSPPTLQELVNNHLFSGVSVAFDLVGFALLGMLLYGGFMYMISGENPQQKAKAQGIIFWAIIGAVIVLASVFIINFVGNILGVGSLDTVSI